MNLKVMVLSTLFGGTKVPFIASNAIISRRHAAQESDVYTGHKVFSKTSSDTLVSIKKAMVYTIAFIDSIHYPDNLSTLTLTLKLTLFLTMTPTRKERRLT